MDHILSFLKRQRILPFPTSQASFLNKREAYRSRLRQALGFEQLEVRKLLTTPPTITDVVDRATLESTATTAIPFTIGDAETPATSLTVSGTSSNTSLVPNANIVFGGSGTNRTVTITPAAGLSERPPLALQSPTAI